MSSRADSSERSAPGIFFRTLAMIIAAYAGLYLLILIDEAVLKTYWIWSSSPEPLRRLIETAYSPIPWP